MRLLRAELTKLRRPLALWTFVALAAFVAVSGWNAVRDARTQYLQNQQSKVFFTAPTSCAEVGLPQGPQCDGELRRQQELARQDELDYRRQLERTAARGRLLQDPLGSGVLAAGMLASVPGALALLLLAAGHVGNEWSGRTIKQVLVQEGRRWRVLAAKLASLWLAGVGLLLGVWAALVPLSFVLDSYRLGGSPLSPAAAWRAAAPQLARAPLVLAAFVVVEVLAAVLTRNTLGSFFLALVFVLGSLVAGNYPVTSRGTLSYWVAGWMGFREVGATPFYLWPGSFPFRGPQPSHQAGLYGLAGLVVAGWLLALARVRRADVKA